MAISDLLKTSVVKGLKETLTEGITRARKLNLGPVVTWKDILKQQRQFENTVDTILKEHSNVLNKLTQHVPQSSSRYKGMVKVRSTRTVNQLNQLLRNYDAFSKKATTVGYKRGKQMGALIGAWYGAETTEDPSFGRIVGFSIAGSFMGGKIFKHYAAMQFSRESLLTPNKIKYIRGKLGHYTERIVGIGKMNVVR